MLQLEELEDLVVEMEEMLSRAVIHKDVTADEVAIKATELDRLFKTSDCTLCIVVEFRHVVDNKTIIRALEYMLRKVRNTWSFESHIKKAVLYRQRG